MTGQAT